MPPRHAWVSVSRVKGPSKSADCNQQQEQQQEEGRQNNAVGILTRSRTTGFGDATAKINNYYFYSPGSIDPRG